MSGTVICVGGGQHATSSYSTDPKAFVTGFGYPWTGSLDPFASVYKLILSQYRPVGQAAGGAWDALAEACMRTRNMLFCNNVPNDCGTSQSSLASGLSVARTAAGLGVSGASAGLGIATALGASISSIAGAALPGVGLALTAILTVYQNHVNAEARQETALCTENPAVAIAMQQIDAAVSSGSATPQQGYSAMVQLSSQFVGALSSIYKSGNAADGYERIFKCQVALSLYRYGLSPLPPSLTSVIETASSASPSPANAQVLGGPTANEEETNGTLEPLPVITTAPAPVLASAAGSSLFGVSTGTLLLILVAVAILWGFSE
jgi:hypothetical protein